MLFLLLLLQCGHALRFADPSVAEVRLNDAGQLMEESTMSKAECVRNGCPAGCAPFCLPEGVTFPTLFPIPGVSEVAATIPGTPAHAAAINAGKQKRKKHRKKKSSRRRSTPSSTSSSTSAAAVLDVVAVSMKLELGENATITTAQAKALNSNPNFRKEVRKSISESLTASGSNTDVDQIINLLIATATGSMFALLEVNGNKANSEITVAYDIQTEGSGAVADFVSKQRKTALETPAMYSQAAAGVVLATMHPETQLGMTAVLEKEIKDKTAGLSGDAKTLAEKQCRDSLEFSTEMQSLLIERNTQVAEQKQKLKDEGKTDDEINEKLEEITAEITDSVIDDARDTIENEIEQKMDALSTSQVKALTSASVSKKSKQVEKSVTVDGVTKIVIDDEDDGDQSR